MDINKEVHYYLVLIKYEKDPVSRAYLLRKLVDAYMKAKQDMPDNVKKFVLNEISRIDKKLRALCEEKRGNAASDVKTAHKAQSFGF